MNRLREKPSLFAIAATILCTTASATMANGGIGTWFTLYDGIDRSMGVMCLVTAIILCVVVEGLVFRIFRLFPSPFEVIPLLDAVGEKCVYVLAHFRNAGQAEEIMAKAEAYR